MENREEFGYPHEIISLSIKWANRVIGNSYRKRTKILSSLILNIFKKTTAQKIEITEKDDLNLRILYYIIDKSSIKLEKSLNKHQEKLKELIKQYKERQSIAAFKSVERFVTDSVFIHIVLKELTGKTLLKKEIIDNLISTTSIGVEMDKILRAIKLLYLDNNEINGSIVNELITGFHSINEFILRLYIAFISFELATKYEAYKNKFLFEHYLSLKNLAKELEGISETQKLDDPVLERLFMTSLILYFCGYQKALRLNHEEKINYFEHVLSIPTIINEFKRAFAKHATVDLKLVKIPLWTALLIDAILIVISVTREIYLPAGLNLLIINISLPLDIPIAGVSSLLLTIYLIFKVYKLREDIIKELRSGGSNET